MRTVGIIGLGLIGGSLAKALKVKGGSEHIVGFDQNRGSLLSAQKDGVVDYAANTVGASFSTCDIVFICTPIDTVFGCIKKLAPFLPAQAVVTDVASTKSGIMALAETLKDVHFIGGHPMAGSEKSGYSASKAYLFENACYALCPTSHTPTHMLEQMTSLVKKIGAMPLVMDAVQHDRAVSAVSHAPHVIAAALVNAVAKLDSDGNALQRLAAGGFKDITRIASANPDLWQTICASNRLEILNTLSCFKAEISAFEEELAREQANVAPHFTRAKQYRDGLDATNVHSYKDIFTIRIDVEDTPGIIAKVAAILGTHGVNIKNIGINNSREYENGVLEIAFDRQDHKAQSVVLLKAMNFTVFES